MIMMVNLGIGLITPPVGAVLFLGSTVSIVLNRRETRIRAETLERVRQATAEFDLRPNQSARRRVTRTHLPAWRMHRVPFGRLLVGMPDANQQVLLPLVAGQLQ